jgi:hypothetical protein
MAMRSDEARTRVVEDERYEVDREHPDRPHERHEIHERRGLGLDRERQHDEFGGFNVGAAFFGWLVAIGVAALLTALLSAAGTAISLTELTTDEAADNAETLSLAGGILMVLVLAISYYAGGYVAGRMSRFDGGRQGFGVWVFGLLLTVTLAVIGAIAGSEYNLLAGLDLPRIPIDEGDLATGAVIALLAALLLTALAAIFGGKTGERYHRKVDAVGLHTETRRV